jgi:thymidylate synthase
VASELLNRTPLEQQPRIELLSNKSFYDFTVDDFKVIDTDGIKKIESKLEIAI